MKKHIVLFGTLFLFIASGSALVAQQDDVAARLAARRAAEAGDTAPAATTAAPPQDAASTTTTVSAGDAATTNATATAVDDDEVRRRAAIAAAIKEAETNLTSLPTNLSASLQIITRRNIFDPRRRPYDPRPIVDALPPVQVETFIFNGSADKIGKGKVAFFSGAGIPAYPTYRCVGDPVMNQFKIKDITDDSVTLVDTASGSSNAEYVLQPTKGLTRNNGGPWRNAYSEITYVSAAPRMQRMDGSEPAQVYRQDLTQSVFTPDSAPSFVTTDPFNSDDTTGNGRGRGRGRQGNNQGGGNGRQRGNGNNGNNAFGNNGFNAGGFGNTGGNNAFAPAQPALPAAPPDPNVLLRLQQRRNSEQ